MDEKLFKVVGAESSSGKELQKVLSDSNLNKAFESKWKPAKLQLVENRILTEDYEVKKQEMLTMGRSGIEVEDDFGFSVKNNVAALQLASRAGLQTKKSGYNVLGYSSMGVYLCKHADVCLQAALAAYSGSDVIRMLICKYIPGKSTTAIPRAPAATKYIEPTEGFDAHVSFIPPSTAESIQNQYDRSQVFIYEKGHQGPPASRPRQVVPYAIVTFTPDGVYLPSIDAKPTPAEKIAANPALQSIVQNINSKPGGSSGIPSLMHEESWLSDPSPDGSTYSDGAPAITDEEKLAANPLLRSIVQSINSKPESLYAEDTYTEQPYDPYDNEPTAEDRIAANPRLQSILQSINGKGGGRPRPGPPSDIPRLLPEEDWSEPAEWPHPEIYSGRLGRRLPPGPPRRIPSGPPPKPTLAERLDARPRFRSLYQDSDSNAVDPYATGGDTPYDPFAYAQPAEDVEENPRHRAYLQNARESYAPEYDEYDPYAQAEPVAGDELEAYPRRRPYYQGASSGAADPYARATYRPEGEYDPYMEPESTLPRPGMRRLNPSNSWSHDTESSYLSDRTKAIRPLAASNYRLKTPYSRPHISQAAPPLSDDRSWAGSARPIPIPPSSVYKIDRRPGVRQAPAARHQASTPAATTSNPALNNILSKINARLASE